MQLPKSEELHRLNEDLEDILDSAPKSRLARSARLLGMYLALYKHHFGELTPAQYTKLNDHVTEQDDIGKSIYTAGMYELIDMLSLVQFHEEDANWHKNSSHSVN